MLKFVENTPSFVNLNPKSYMRVISSGCLKHRDCVSSVWERESSASFQSIPPKESTSRGHSDDSPSIGASSCRLTAPTTSSAMQFFFLFLVFYLFMHMHATCWNYEHGTLDDHRMGMQCIFVHSGTLMWYANEMYAYALKDIFLTFFL